MARKSGSDGEKTQSAIREAALDLISRRGYEAVTMRELAAAVGVQPAALYRYFPAKQDLLFTLMRGHMEALLAAWQAARPASGNPVAQLAAFVENHIRFHVERRQATHISNMELRSLSPERLTTMLRLRNAYEKELRAILRAGLEDGSFTLEDVGLTAMAIIQMVTGVIVWFRPGARLSMAGVTQSYLGMTMRLVGARPEDSHSKGDGRGYAHAELRAG